MTLSNVYMSFSDEAVYVAQIGQGPGTPPGSKWNIASNYKVFKDKEAAKSKKSNIRIFYQVPVSSLSGNSYEQLYEQLKKDYPGSYDDIDDSQLPPTSNLVVSNETLVSLYKDINSDGTDYIIPDGTSNLVLTTAMLSQLSNVINSFTFTPVPEPVEEPPQTRGDALLAEALNNTEN